MNEYQSIESGSGILKDYYDQETKSKAMKEALKRKRQKMMDNKNMPSYDIASRQERSYTEDGV